MSFLLGLWTSNVQEQTGKISKQRDKRKSSNRFSSTRLVLTYHEVWGYFNTARDEFSTGWKFVRSGVPFTRNYLSRTENLDTWSYKVPYEESKIIERSRVNKVSPHVRESKTDLDSGFHAVDSGFPGTGFQSLSVEPGFWIPTVSVIPDSLSCIPDSTSKRFLDSGIWIPLHEANLGVGSILSAGRNSSGAMHVIVS